MNNSNDAIISIKPIYVDAILSGTKTVELRRRIPPIELGTKFWIYATRPTAAILGTAVLKDVVRVTPDQLWNEYGALTGVDRPTYENYFCGSNVALGLIIGDVKQIDPIDIGRLRERLDRFHPPQVISRLSPSDANSISQLALAA